VNNLIEETTKLQTFMRGLRSGDSAEAVAYETANYGGSPNFSRIGAWGQASNLLIMFYNARLQGTDADIRRLASDPSVRLRATLYLLVPALLLWLYNQHYRDDHGLEELNPSERQRFYTVLLPYTYQHSDGSTRRAYIKIAKEQTEQVLGTLLEQGLDHLAMRHPASVEKMGADFLGNLSPVPFDLKGSGAKAWAASAGSGLITSANPALRIPTELLSNQNYFLRRPIVPKAEERRRAEDQYGPTTAPLAITLGRATGLSPRKLQYAVTSGTGGVGQTALDLTSKVLADPRPDARGEYERAARLPIASRFLGTGGNYQVLELKERFYDRLDESRKLAESIKFAQRKGETARVRELRAEHAFANRTYLDNVGRQLAEIRNEARRVAEDPRLTTAGRTRRQAALAAQEETIMRGFEKLEERRGATAAR